MRLVELKVLAGANRPAIGGIGGRPRVRAVIDELPAPSVHERREVFACAVLCGSPSSHVAPASMFPGRWPWPNLPQGRDFRVWQVVLAASVGMLAIHFQAIMRDAGVSTTAAAADYATLGPALIVGRLGTGFMLDRMPSRIVAAISFAMPVAACVMGQRGVFRGRRIRPGLGAADMLRRRPILPSDRPARARGSSSGRRPTGTRTRRQ
jgi:hypothetical protein